MNIANKRLTLGMCALALAQVVTAANLKSKAAVDTDNKDAKIVNVTATLPDGTGSFRCQYAWQVTFKNGASTNDACEVDVPAGTKASVVCTKTYDQKVSQVVLVQQRCDLRK